MFQPTDRLVLSPSGLTALALSLFVLSGCGKSHQSQPLAQPDSALVSVRVQKAESKPRSITEEVVATVRARTRATLEAKVSGRIDKMAVVLGQRVKAGQLLIHLDAAEIKARLEQAQATLAQAERDWKRISALFDGQAATRSEYDAADSRLRVAKAGVTEAQAMQDYVEVAAPFDGLVTRKWADVGDQAAPGKPLIDVEDPASLQVEADIPEAIASHILHNAQIPIQLDSMTNELTGKVAEISPITDPLSRTLRVKLDLPTPANLPTDTGSPLLRSGQFARLLVPTGESNPICVPVGAVVQRGQLEIVFVVEGGRARMRLVKSGKSFGGEVEVLSGLDAGESVVVENPARLADGQPVRGN